MPKQKQKQKQKFARGSRVRILNADERNPIRVLPTGDIIGYRQSHRAMFHGDEGIIVGSYRQQFGHGEPNKYTLVVLNDQGKPVNRVSWFDEDKLELVSDDRLQGHDLVDAFSEDLAS